MTMIEHEMLLNILKYYKVFLNKKNEQYFKSELY